MRIATWNVAYGVGKATNQRRLRLMAKVDADVWVLTETHDSLSLHSPSSNVEGYLPVD